MEPSQADRDAVQTRFSGWARHWYKLQHGETATVDPYVTKAGQLQCGDVVVRVDGRAVNYDEKVFTKTWDGLLVELLQASEPNSEGRPLSLGWFYELADCHYLLCGYYAQVDDDEPEVVYRVSLRRLRAFYPRLVRTTGALRSHAILSDKGYGITVCVVIPWDLLLANGCVERVYERPVVEETTSPCQRASV